MIGYRSDAFKDRPILLYSHTPRFAHPLRSPFRRAASIRDLFEAGGAGRRGRLSIGSDRQAWPFGPLSEESK
jgi:hypothetical protein